MNYYIHCHLTWTNAVHTLYLHCPLLHSNIYCRTTLPKVYSKVYTYKANLTTII